jgi:hypothetical protein
MARDFWILVCRLSLIAAFVLAFFAVIFNVDLLSYVGNFAPISHAQAAVIQLHSFAVNSITGLTLLVVILLLVLVSFFGPIRRPRNK